MRCQSFLSLHSKRSCCQIHQTISYFSKIPNRHLTTRTNIRNSIYWKFLLIFFYFYENSVSVGIFTFRNRLNPATLIVVTSRNRSFFRTKTPAEIAAPGTSTILFNQLYCCADMAWFYRSLLEQSIIFFSAHLLCLVGHYGFSESVNFLDSASLYFVLCLIQKPIILN